MNLRHIQITFVTHDILSIQTKSESDSEFEDCETSIFSDDDLGIIML